MTFLLNWGVCIQLFLNELVDFIFYLTLCYRYALAYDILQVKYCSSKNKRDWETVTAAYRGIWLAIQLVLTRLFQWELCFQFTTIYQERNTNKHM